MSCAGAKYNYFKTRFYLHEAVAECLWFSFTIYFIFLYPGNALWNNHNTQYTVGSVGDPTFD
jgi:hypothetical protein